MCEPVFAYTELAFLCSCESLLSLFPSLTFSLSLSVAHIHSLLFIFFLSLSSHMLVFIFLSGKLPFSPTLSFHDCGVASSSVYDTAEQQRSVLWLLGYRETQRISEELLRRVALSIKELFKSSYCDINLEKKLFCSVLHCDVTLISKQMQINAAKLASAFL